MLLTQRWFLSHNMRFWVATLFTRSRLDQLVESPNYFKQIYTVFGQTAFFRANFWNDTKMTVYLFCTQLWRLFLMQQRRKRKQRKLLHRVVANFSRCEIKSSQSNKLYNEFEAEIQYHWSNLHFYYRWQWVWWPFRFDLHVYIFEKI